jgi:hypothetical protein
LTTRNPQSTNRNPARPDDPTQTPTTPSAARATQTGSSATSDPNSPTGQVTDQVKQSASQVTEQAKQTASSQLAARKDVAAQSLDTVSSAVRKMGDQLRQNDQTSGYAQYAHQAADQIDRFSGYLQNHHPREIMSDAENWARRNPAVVLGGAFALGLLASRFLKSGMGGQSQSGSSQYGQSSQYRYTNRPYWNDPYNDRYRIAGRAGRLSISRDDARRSRVADGDRKSACRRSGGF